MVFGTRERDFTVEAPEGPITQALVRYLGGHRYTGAPEDRPESEPDVTVVPWDTGYQLRSARDQVPAAFPTLDEALAELEYGIVRFLLEQHRVLTHLHASGAVVPAGQGTASVIAVGPSGAGKSSLALAWSRLGLPLLGDDVLMVDGAGHAVPFRRPVKVNESLLARSAPGAWGTQHPAVRPEEDERWYDPGDAGGWAQGAAPVRLVAALTRDDGVEGADVHLTPLSTGEGLGLLFTALLGTGAGGPESLPCLSRLAEGARFVAVRFGDSRAAAQALADAARS